MEDDECHRLARVERGEERDPIFTIDDRVIAIAEAEQIGERRKRIERKPAADAMNSDSIDDLDTFSPVIALAEPADLAAGSGPAARDLMHIQLGAASPRMGDVTPVADQDSRCLSLLYWRADFGERVAEIPPQESGAVR